ncbi:DEAD/DEAH box helicase family protein [bacterium]|nr:DEAD/DEAH box helicase family protein [bacterium]
MSEQTPAYEIAAGQRVRVKGRLDLGAGEVLRISDNFGVYVADVVFDSDDGRRLETIPLERLELVPDMWERARRGDWDDPRDFILKQLAHQLPMHNTGGQLSNSRTDLLPHQILLTRDVVLADRRRFLIADEVGLGKTIETGMIVRELAARGEAERILVIAPAGLVKNWQNELRDAFRLPFDILGLDFRDHSSAIWEHKHRVIASIDLLKRPARIERLLAGPRWDIVVFDEAHHLSRKRYGKKTDITQNYKLAEALRSHTRDLFFLSATPHQGDNYQFWSLVALLDEQLFPNPAAIEAHRALLNRVMIRRTKREVTNAHGEPIFMRRQVQSQIFDQAARERRFYDQLTEYLREGYNAAGITQARTTSKQRAIGFVMTTFQKIMSSSPRAIIQALRRRLMVLLTRHMLGLERKRRETHGARLADEILNVQDEIRALARDVAAMRRDLGDDVDAESLATAIRQRIARTLEEDTSWALDGDEDGDEGIYADADIPNEAAKVRELITLAPTGPDRKFLTLTRAIDDLRRQNPDERFVIFTQYLETLGFLCEELGKLYGADTICVIRGGALERKIAAMGEFWKEDGARFLISTSAGGEGINLQVGHILFNYDLPWNPMAVEQRIGRIHRYGQHDTCQVYNLIARDTVEERIYALLDRKLGDIARTIGRVDPATGEPTEDFRSQILGLLGASPNYQALYMKALVDKDYARTEREIEDALQKAREAADAMNDLTQDLTAFNLQDYLRIEGAVTLEDLRAWAERATLRLGGSVLPDNGTERINTPAALLAQRGVAARYDGVTFDRPTAMRLRKADLMGIGHPLIDALLAHTRGPLFSGDVSFLRTRDSQDEPTLLARAMLHVEGESRHVVREVKTLQIDKNGSVTLVPDEWDLNILKSGQYEQLTMPVSVDLLPWDRWKEAYETAIRAILTQTRVKVENPVSARVVLLGLSVVV